MPLVGGAKTRRGEDMIPLYDIRAGFEPFRGAAIPNELSRIPRLYFRGVSWGCYAHGAAQIRRGIAIRGSTLVGAPRPAAATLWRGPVQYCGTPRD